MCLAMEKGEFRASQVVALVAVFAALNVITDSFGRELPQAGIWYSWNFSIEPLTGIVLGPLFGFASNFIGVMIGHYVNPIGVYEFLFTIGAPIGAAVSALMFKGRWKLVLVYYVALFTAYFITPVSWQLPLWGMWDTYIAFFVLIATILLVEKGVWRNETHERTSFSLILAASAFVGLEADILFRIFIFIPGQTYSLFYDLNIEALQAIWGSAALITPAKAVLSTMVTVIIGHPLIRTLRKAGILIYH